MKNESPQLSDDQIAARLCAMLTQEMLYKADCFDYLCWLAETEQRENVKTADFLVLASDGTTCWGKSYADCVKVAMQHDKELYDAVKNLENPITTPPSPPAGNPGAERTPSGNSPKE